MSLEATNAQLGSILSASPSSQDKDLTADLWDLLSLASVGDKPLNFQLQDCQSLRRASPTPPRPPRPRHGLWERHPGREENLELWGFVDLCLTTHFLQLSDAGQVSLPGQKFPACSVEKMTYTAPSPGTARRHPRR